jgi:hypothetical protein
MEAVLGITLGLAYVAGIALLVGIWRTLITPRLVRLASCGCGLALIGLG